MPKRGGAKGRGGPGALSLAARHGPTANVTSSQKHSTLGGLNRVLHMPQEMAPTGMNE